MYNDVVLNESKRHNLTGFTALILLVTGLAAIALPLLGFQAIALSALQNAIR